MNFLQGRVTAGRINVPGLGRDLAAPGTARDGMEVQVGLRPEHLAVTAGGDHGEDHGGDFSVDLTESLGGVSYAHLLTATGEKVVVEERGEHRSAAGARVGIEVDPAQVFVFDAQSGMRLR